MLHVASFLWVHILNTSQCSLYLSFPWELLPEHWILMHTYWFLTVVATKGSIHPFFWATMNQLLSCHHHTSTMVFFWAPKLPAKADSDFLQANTNHYMKQPAILPCPSHKIHLLIKVICLFALSRQYLPKPHISHRALGTQALGDDFVSFRSKLWEILKFE